MMVKDGGMRERSVFVVKIFVMTLGLRVRTKNHSCIE